MRRVLSCGKGFGKPARGPWLMTLEDAGLGAGAGQGGEAWVAGASRAWKADAGALG